MNYRLQDHRSHRSQITRNQVQIQLILKILLIFNNHLYKLSITNKNCVFNIIHVKYTYIITNLYVLNI